MRVTVSALDVTYKLLHHEKSYDAREHPQADAHVVAVSSLPVGVSVIVGMGMRVIVSCVVMRRYGMGNEMQKRVAQ